MPDKKHPLAKESGQGRKGETFSGAQHILQRSPPGYFPYVWLVQADNSEVLFFHSPENVPGGLTGDSFNDDS